MTGYKQVIVVRDDLKMSRGKLAAQVAHASLNSAEKARDKKPDWHEGWKKSQQKKVVVKAPTIDDLKDLKKEAEIQNMPNDLVQDAGHTELSPNTYTTLGVGPGPNENVDKITGHLKLLG
mgnify:CR=1 FL=1